MNKKLQILFFIICSFLLGLSFNNLAISNPETYRIAVVDINAVLEKSSQMQALKFEQAQKSKALQKWLNAAREDINKQSQEEDRQKAIQKYDDIFENKQAEIKSNYEKKLKIIDKDISAIIKKVAEEQNFNLVLTKNSVLYGGTDITPSVIPLIK